RVGAAGERCWGSPPVGPSPRFPAIVASLSSPSTPPSLAGRAERVEAILRELRGGAPPEERFRCLFEIYYGPLRGFFARRGFPPEDCQELTQETFLGIYMGMGSFRGEAGFETWMWKIANNAWPQ